LHDRGRSNPLAARSRALAHRTRIDRRLACVLHVWIRRRLVGLAVLTLVYEPQPEGGMK